MTRIAGFLADHYAKYYDELDPPLNRGLIVAADDPARHRQAARAGVPPVEAKYTKEGCLIGHVLMGRDMVREAAGQIEGFPTELLLLPGTCDPGASRQARVRVAGRPTDPGGTDRFVSSTTWMPR